MDKGSGWGEHEGKAIVFSKPIVYRTLPKIPRDVIERRNIEKLYPPNSCRYVRTVKSPQTYTPNYRTCAIN